MEIERAYVGGSSFFAAWVALMENHTRVMEVRDSDLHDAKILIISAPTDRGLAALTEANRQGESFLLCFSREIEDIAQGYCRRRGISNLVTVVAPFFSIPSDKEEFDAVYANCFFDLCDPSEVDAVVDEMWRVLKPGGYLYSVHMGQPSRMAGRVWAWFLRRFPSGECCFVTAKSRFQSRSGSGTGKVWVSTAIHPGKETDRRLTRRCNRKKEGTGGLLNGLKSEIGKHDENESHPVPLRPRAREATGWRNGGRVLNLDRKAERPQG